MRRIAGLIGLGLLTLALAGCGIQRAVVRSTMGPILEGGMESMMAEEDLGLAKTSLESNLKLMEGMLEADPENVRLHLLSSQGFTAYGMGFVEDTEPVRARNLYLRGRAHAGAWLASEHGANPAGIRNLKTLRETVAGMDEDAVPGLFWLANGWASALLTSLDDPSAIGDLARVETIMQRVIELDEDFFFGGAHLFFGAFYGARPPMLGGNPDKAREHLDRADELTGGKSLMVDYFRVRYVHLTSLDGEAARSTLEAMLAETPADWPGDLILMNRIAQKRARFLLANLDDYL